MRLSQLRELVREVLHELEEANTTGNAGGSYLTPHAFSRSSSTSSSSRISRSSRDNRATKQAKSIGYSKVKKKKRPYSTKLIDYLNNE